MITTSIDPDKIVTEGKLDLDLLEDPVMALVDLAIEKDVDAEEDLMKGHMAHAAMVDIIARNDPEFQQDFGGQDTISADDF